MNWRSYPVYRPTEMHWIESIPAHWRILKLKYLSRTQLSNVDKNSNKDEIPVRLCNYIDVYRNDFIRNDTQFMEATATPVEISRFSLQSGDVLVTKDSESWNDIAVAALVDDDLAGVLCGYHLAQIRSNPLINGRYLFRSFQTHGLNEQFQVASRVSPDLD